MKVALPVLQVFIFIFFYIIILDYTLYGDGCGSNCAEGKFMSGGSCISCNVLCKYCFGSNVNECYECRKNRYYIPHLT